MQHNNINWQPCTGSYSSRYQTIADEIHLIFHDNQAINYMNYKNKYLIIAHGNAPKLLYIDPQGKPEVLCDKNDEKYENFKEHVLNEITIRPLNYFDNKYDFYIIPSLSSSNTNESLESRLLKEIHNREEVDEKKDKTQRIKEGRVCFVMHENICYFVDRKLNTAKKLNCSPEKIKEINRIVGSDNSQTHGYMQHKELVINELRSLIESLSNQLEGMIMIKNDRIIPNLPELSVSNLSSAFNEYIHNIIHSSAGHTKGQFNLYKAEITTDQYFPSQGNALNEFKTFKEIDNESIVQSLLKTLESTLGNETWYKDKFLSAVKELKKTENQTDAIIFVIKLIASHFSTHSGADPDLVNKKMMDRLRNSLKEIHNKFEISPRCGKIYEIPPGQAIKVISAGESESANFDYHLSQLLPSSEAITYISAWIVSDVDPKTVQQNMNSIDQAHGHSFVCFSQLDALELQKKLKAYHSANKVLLQYETFDIRIYKNQKFSDYMQLKSANIIYHEIIKIEQELNKLCSKHNNYIDEYNTRSESLLRKPKAEVALGVLSADQFSQLALVKNIYGAAKELKSFLDNYINGKPNTVNDVDAINQKLSVFHTLVRTYINSHPYHDPNTDTVCKAAAAIEQCKKKIPDILNAEEESLSKSNLIKGQTKQIKQDLFQKLNSSELKEFMQSFIKEKLTEIKGDLSYRSVLPEQQALVEKLFYLILYNNVEKLESMVKNYGTDMNAFNIGIKNSTSSDKSELSLSDILDVHNLVSYSKLKDTSNTSMFARKLAVTPENQPSTAENKQKFKS